jgi:hypothetical protein
MRTLPGCIDILRLLKKSVLLRARFIRAVAVAFLVVIPEGNLLLFLVLATIFRVFSPKIACQVPKSPENPLTNT